MNARKFCGAAALAAGLLLAMTAPAAAAEPAEPTLTVTPATDLARRTTVQAAVSGFQPGEVVYLGQCVDSGEELICNEASIQQIRVDANGAGSGAVPVRSRFVGTILDGGEWGTVNCKTFEGGCFVVATDEQIVDSAYAELSFR